MTLQSYSAKDLFDHLTNQNEMIILDVRNEEDFSRFNVEGPFQFDIMNIPYFDFIEEEIVSVSKVPQDKPIKVVCAKEGSAQYVGEILVNHGFENVSYLSGGIKTWGNLLAPKRINSQSDSYALFQFIRPGKASCNYGLIYDAEMIIFDPSKNIEFYESFAISQNSKIVKTFETHLQADYISGSKEIANKTGAEIFAHNGDFKEASFQYSTVNDGESYSVGKDGPEIRVLHSPGHTPGSTSYIVDNKYIISGDTVFIQSIGRPDLGGKVEEWSIMLYDTLTNKIMGLNGDLDVLPGHYMDWNEANSDLIFSEKLAYIIKHNVHVYNMDSAEKFTEFIKDNMRKSPDIYREIRRVNTGWLDVKLDEADVMDLGKNECTAMAYNKIKG